MRINGSQPKGQPQAQQARSEAQEQPRQSGHKDSLFVRKQQHQQPAVQQKQQQADPQRSQKQKQQSNGKKPNQSQTNTNNKVHSGQQPPQTHSKPKVKTQPQSQPQPKPQSQPQSQAQSQPQTKQDQQPQQQQQAQQNGGPKPKERKKPRSKQKKTKEKLTDSKVILESILAKTSYKVPLLSKDVERKFLEDDDYRKAISDIVYTSTVDSNFGEISVKPADIRGSIQPAPGAITTLSCIHEKQQNKRHRWGRKKKVAKRPLEDNNNGKTDGKRQPQQAKGQMNSSQQSADPKQSSDATSAAEPNVPAPMEIQ